MEVSLAFENYIKGNAPIFKDKNEILNNIGLKELLQEKEKLHFKTLDNQKNELINSKEKYEDLDEKVAKICVNLHEAQLKQDRKGRQDKKIREEADKQRIELLEKTRNKEELEKQLAALEARIAEEEKLLLSSEQIKQSAIERGTKCIDLYRQNFGIQITNTSRQSFVFTFTNISRKNPEREYLLELSIPENEYKLHKTIPEIKNLEALEEQLNESDDLSGFLAHLRSLFTKME